MQLERRVTWGWGRRGEESAALKDGNGCHLLTVKLILSSLPCAFVYGREAAVSLLFYLCLRLYLAPYLNAKRNSASVP